MTDRRAILAANMAALRLAAKAFEPEAERMVAAEIASGRWSEEWVRRHNPGRELAFAMAQTAAQVAVRERAGGFNSQTKRAA